jgi:transcriptional regulator with XRE-family HTH domain
VANDLRRAVGGNLLAIRKARGLTQERFAHRYGYQRSWVGNVENAKLNLTIDIVQRLADRMEVEVFVLVRRLGEPSAAPLAEPAEEEADEDSAEEDADEEA